MLVGAFARIYVSLHLDLCFSLSPSHCAHGFVYLLAVDCPANSNGIAVDTGCDCNAGFSGSVSATTASPFYVSTCAGRCFCVDWVFLMYVMLCLQTHAHHLCLDIDDCVDVACSLYDVNAECIDGVGTVPAQSISHQLYHAGQ